MKRILMSSSLALIFSLAAAPGFSAEQTQSQTQNQTQMRIYGSQLMTQQERLEFRARMRAAKTLEEREQIRLEHHQRMQERAKAQGITLPDEPMPMGRGMGQGGGMGGGGMQRGR